MKNIIQKKIYSRIEAVEESLKYTIEALCEISGDLNTISYLMYLINENSKNSQTTDSETI